MSDDIAGMVGAVTRELRSETRDGKPARAVVAARSYDTTLDDLWDALTSAERIPRWLLPIEGDLRLGGRYQLKGNAGGMIERCEPPHLLAITWEYGGEISWVTVALSQDGVGARLELTHVAHVDDARWDEFGPGAVGVGWDLSLMGMERHLRDRDARVDPAKGMAWMGSPEGKRFMTLSSDDWRRASIAAGEDAAKATAAAERTRAAYCGG